MKLQGKAEAASEVSQAVSPEAISASISSAMAPLVSAQTLELIDLAKITAEHKEQLLKDHLSAVLLENKQLQLTLNIIRDMLMIVLNDSEHQEVVDFVRQVNAEIDGMIEPLKNYTYDPRSPCCEIKDYRERSVQTLFGNVTIRIPRLRMRGRTISFVNWPSHARATPDLDFIRIKCCAWMSYPKAMQLLGEVCPVEGGVTIGAAYEKVKKFAWSTAPDRTRNTGSSKEIFLPIDTTFVKGLPEQSDTSLEIMVGAAEATRGKQKYFSAPMSMHAHCLRLGHETLDKAGRTEKSKVVSFTDAGGNVQRLARELGATDLPITDWFHISMRIRHVEAIAGAIRTPNRSFEASKASIIRKIARLRLRLWRGKRYAIAKARRDLAPLLRTYRGDEDPKTWKSQGNKLLAAIRKLEAYINNPKTRLIDYCARQQSSKRVSTSLVEGGADFIVNARMGRKQHMRWSTRGAFQILQARTADINGTLEEKLLAA